MNEEVALLLERHPHLTEKEATELRFVVKAQQPVLGKALAEQLSNLFLQGLGCSEIHKANPTLSLGQIVRARVDYGWDGMREEYLRGLLSKARDVAQQAAMEGAQFVSLHMAAYQKLHGDRFRKYLQTGNAEDLGDSITLLTPSGYKAAVDMLLKVTGQDKVQRVTGKIEHTVMAAGPTVRVPINRPITADESKAVIQGMMAAKAASSDDDVED